MSPADSGSQQATPRLKRPHSPNSGLVPAGPARQRLVALRSVPPGHRASAQRLPASVLQVRLGSGPPSQGSVQPPDSVPLGQLASAPHRAPRDW